MIFMLKELLRYRELLLFMIWRDVSVRYKQTILGFLWAVLQPLAAMLVFTVVFNRGLGLEVADVPYPLFVLAGYVPWQIFATSLNRSGESLVINANLITKIYFPRMILPMAATMAFSVDFLCSLLIMVPMMIYYRFAPGIEVLAVPLLMVMLMAFSAAAGMLFSSLNVRFRDVKYLLGFLLQMWFFITPVVYPSSKVPEKFRVLMLLNPMTGVIQGFGWALTGAPFPGTELAVSAALIILIFIVAQAYFNRVERTFADVI